MPQADAFPGSEPERNAPKRLDGNPSRAAGAGILESPRRTSALAARAWPVGVPGPGHRRNIE